MVVWQEFRNIVVRLLFEHHPEKEAKNNSAKFAQIAFPSVFEEVVVE
jgi:hypothetical protein